MWKQIDAQIATHCCHLHSDGQIQLQSLCENRIEIQHRIMSTAKETITGGITAVHFNHVTTPPISLLLHDNVGC